MNADTFKRRSSQGRANSPSASSSASSFMRTLLVLVALGAAALFFWFHKRTHTTEVPQPIESQQASVDTNEEPVPVASPREKPFEKAGPGVIARRQSVSNVQLAVTAVPGVLPPEAIPAQQLLNNIAQFGLQQGSMTPDQA